MGNGMMTITTAHTIDADTYHELQEIMADEFTELLDVFHQDVVAAIDALQQSITQGDSQQVGIICHKLKSSSRLIGAFGMAELARLLEEYKDDQDQIRAMQHWQQLNTTYTEVCVWLNAHAPIVTALSA